MDAARARARAAADATVPPGPAGAAPVAPPTDTWASLSAPAPPDPMVSLAPIPTPGGAQDWQPTMTDAPFPTGAAAYAPPADPADATEGLPTGAWHSPEPDAVHPGSVPSGPADPLLSDGPLVLTDEFRAPSAFDQPEPAAYGPGAAPLAAAARVPPIPATVSTQVFQADPAFGPALLSLDGVATDIGRYRILQDMTFHVPKEAVTMLLGRNGAGKTTTLRTIMGLWQARAGEIALAGHRIERWSTHRIARLGVGYVPESMCIFGDLTVAENIALGARSGPVSRDRLDWLTGLFPPLATFWRAPAGNLSGGQKQMLALARALVEKRRLYLIDEPTKGLAPVMLDSVVAALRDLKLQGATILMVEQNFAVARALGDACVVVDDGRVTWQGTMDALACDVPLQTRLLGLDLGDAA